MKTETYWVVERDGTYFNQSYYKWRTDIRVATFFADKTEAEECACTYQSNVSEVTLTIK